MYNNIARFRVSSHNLKIETGRHDIPKTPVEERICEKCTSKEVEDEIHCLLTCSLHLGPRIEMINKVLTFIPDFNCLNKTEQFETILSSKEPAVIYALGNFLNEIMQLPK